MCHLLLTTNHSIISFIALLLLLFFLHHHLLHQSNQIDLKHFSAAQDKIQEEASKKISQDSYDQK